jgi:hypothetical protein
MLYIIGGASRAGKTLLAQRMQKERNTPYFCLDYFVTALEHGAPELGIKGESPNLLRSLLLWPRIEPMLKNIVEVEPAYVVEGDAMLPRDVAALSATYGNEICTCFIGYAAATAAQKLADIRAFGAVANDWTQGYPDKYVLELCQEMIEFSRFVQKECGAYGIPYFDVSVDFTASLAKAYMMLCGHR